MLPTGTQAESLKLRTPRENLFVNGQMDYAVTLDQTLRFGYNLTRFTNENLGVGGYDEPERAYSNQNRTHNIRVQHFGPFGRRAFLRSRVQMFIADSETVSATQAPTIRVNDFFTSGGAQLAGGEHSKRLNVAIRSGLRARTPVVARRHRRSTAGGIDPTRRRTTSAPTRFDNMDAYLANRPSNYSRRIGDPNLSFGNVQFGFYVQDDIRPRKNLTLSPGVRYEAQSHVGGVANIGPRFGVTWAPTASGQTTLRASTGIFYDWLPTGTYEQSLRVDGVRQQELNVFNPSYPDPGSFGAIPPINKYLLDAGYEMPRITRISGGVDQGFLRVNRVAMTYSYQRGSRLARGSNLNAAVNGVRPDPAFRNIVQAVSDAASTPASGDRRRQPESRRDAPGLQGTAHQLEAHDRLRQLSADLSAEQHGRRVRHSRDRRSERRVGTGGERRAASREHRSSTIRSCATCSWA